MAEVANKVRKVAYSKPKRAKPLVASEPLVEYQVVVGKIIVLRGQRIIFAHDLAELYGVETKVLMQAVKRNTARFPADFAFSITEQEFRNLKSQIVTSSWGGARKSIHAFSEQGVAMLSSVLRSPRAVEVNIEIMRAFVQMRSMIDSNKVLSRKVAEMEAEYDEQFAFVFKAMRELMDDKSASEKQAAKSKRKIGFT